jgi:hypothetical protein
MKNMNFASPERDQSLAALLAVMEDGKRYTRHDLAERLSWGMNAIGKAIQYGRQVGALARRRSHGGDKFEKTGIEPGAERPMRMHPGFGTALRGYGAWLAGRGREPGTVV